MGETRRVFSEKFPDETFVYAEGLDDAIMGIDQESMRVIYSVYRCLSILAMDMSMSEAISHFEKNISNSFTDEKRPIWCKDNI
jgi:hypothetical protein